MIVQYALRLAASRYPQRGVVLPLLQHRVSVLGGLGIGAGITAALCSGGRNLANEAQATTMVRAWLPSPASLVGEPTVACEPAAAANQRWQDEFDDWAQHLTDTCGDGGLTPRKPYSGRGASDGHWTAEWHLMRGKLWGEGGLEKLQIWRPKQHMIDGEVLCLVRLGGQVCGHRQFVHGGFTAALFDELFGATME